MNKIKEQHHDAKISIKLTNNSLKVDVWEWGSMTLNAKFIFKIMIQLLSHVDCFY